MDTSDKNLKLYRSNMPHEKGHRYPPEKKIEVVTKWMATGNMRLVAGMTGVDYQLIRYWKTLPWWADLVAEIRASRDMQVDNKLGKLVDKSLDVVGDRLENGNIVWNKKTDSYERKPVTLSEANKVANDLLTQQLNLSKKKVVESIGDKQKSIQDQIKGLALEFAKFNTNRTVEVQAKVIDNALHDEREEGLQEAVREVRLETGEHSRPLSEESGPSGDDQGWEGESGGWEGCGPHQSLLEGGIEQTLESEGGDTPPQSFFS